MKFTGERIIPNISFCGKGSKAFLEHVARYEFAGKFVSDKQVLDIACGVGYGSKILWDSGCSKVYGCDKSKDAIEYAKEQYSNPSIIFDVMNASKMSFTSNYFDCIVSFETIEHIKDYKSVINEFHRVLKDNGLLIISTPNKEITSKGKDKPGNKFHEQEFTKKEFLELLEEKFHNVELFSQLLVVKISITKKIFRYIIHLLMKIDFLKIHTKLPSKIYNIFSNMLDNTNRDYQPIPYNQEHNPLVLIAVCKKK